MPRETSLKLIKQQMQVFLFNFPGHTEAMGFCGNGKLGKLAAGVATIPRKPVWHQREENRPPEARPGGGH